MSRYRQLLQLSLSGVQAPLSPALAELAAEWGANDSAAQAFYQAAALLTQAERSARPLPASSIAALSLAPDETLPAQDYDLAWLFNRALTQPNAWILQEAAELLIARAEHLDHSLLPAWFGYLLKQPVADREIFMQCTGQRGPWLAALNPQWKPLLGQPQDDATWETGSLPDRAAWLAAQRQRDPAAARSALQAVWPQEPPEAREALLACLGIGLGLDDEALLETARGDKRKEVRRLALDLLARLPQSAYARRLLERAGAWLTHTPGGLLRSARIEVQLPAAYDKRWALDGIAEKTTRQHEKIGDKANWLVELLSRVPLAALLSQLQITPNDWAKCITGHEYETALWTGSVAGFSLKPTPELLAALHGAPTPVLKSQLQVTALDALASSRDLDAWLPQLLRDDYDLNTTISRLPRLDARWSRELLARLRKRTDTERDRIGLWASSLPAFAERMHASLLPELLALLDPLGNEPYVGKIVEHATSIADLRHKLHPFQPGNTS